MNFSQLKTSGGFLASGAYGALKFLNIYGNDFDPAVIIVGKQAHHNTVWCNNIQGNPATKGNHSWEGVKIWNGAYENLIDRNHIHGNSIGIHITANTYSPHHNTLTSNWIGSVGYGTVPNTKAGIVIVTMALTTTRWGIQATLTREM